MARTKGSLNRPKTPLHVFSVKCGKCTESGDGQDVKTCIRDAEISCPHGKLYGFKKTVLA